MVTGFGPLVGAMQNDVKDRHVVAAAVKAGAQVIISANLKDFTRIPDGVEAESPVEVQRQALAAHAPATGRRRATLAADAVEAGPITDAWDASRRRRSVSRHHPRLVRVA